MQFQKSNNKLGAKSSKARHAKFSPQHMQPEQKRKRTKHPEYQYRMQISEHTAVPSLPSKN
ncbi:hypothetical protein BPOR_0330g00020 [Botrytis porri]|uniref:Uncharacterized protein n=1 Tax=Botrytis porri TaxID=87229 RepID=A0A4Z1KLC9_9HELO|nr:hypothetical protein BPOR_0330g00020 [Botrytis porri]